MQHWYVVQTKPKKEGAVQLQLQRARYEFFYPVMRRIDRIKPLFPSYMFVRANFNDAHSHQLVRYTRGVNKILGHGNQPCPIADEVVEVLMEQTRNGTLIEQELLLRPGDTVTVRRGILKDLMGIVKENVSEVGRVKVLFKWFQKSMSAVLPYAHLERVAV